MRDTIAIFLGNYSSFNVQQTTLNIAKILNDKFTIDLVMTRSNPLQKVDTTYINTHTPTAQNGLRGEIEALRRYFDTYTPSVVMQIGQVPKYGNMISLFKDNKTTFVCRYSGDLFNEYQLHYGVNRMKLFMLKNGLGRLPLRTADRFITMGPNGKDELIARHTNADEIGILPPPIDGTRFEKSQRPSLDIPDSRSIALFVGRVSRLKGAETFQRTIPRILERRSDLHFVFVGEEQFDFEFDQTVRDHISQIGPVSPDLVPGYHELADVYLHPSLSEGLSRSVLEAITAGTPVLARDVGDLSYATSNTFTSDDEFVEMVVDYESLDQDDPHRFTIDEQQPAYRDFFTNVSKGR